MHKGKNSHIHIQMHANTHANAHTDTHTHTHKDTHRHAYRNNNNNNNNWDNLYSAVHMGITKNKVTVTYKLIVIRLSKQKGLEVCFKAVYCR